MTKRTIARTSAMILCVLATLSSAAQAKTAAMSHAHHAVPAAPAACLPTFTADDLLAYIAARLRLVNAQMDQYFQISKSGQPTTEAELIELQRLLSERETWLQMWVNTIRFLLNPPADVPNADDDCTPVDSGQ